MSETANSPRTYAGGCHCGQVRFEATVALNQAMACNCSMCGKKGTLLSFLPATQFKLLQGENGLTDYQFGKKRIHHLFCNKCGVTSFARATDPQGTPTIALNIRCLDDVDPSTVPVKHFDGRSL